MVAQTVASVQQLILYRTGDTPDQQLAGGVLNTLWLGRADKAGVWPTLQMWYTQRDAIDFLLEQPVVRLGVSFSMSGDLALKLDELRQHLTKRRKETQDEIDTLECRARANAPGFIEPIKRTEPELPPFGLPPDANWRRYRGDPYWRPDHRRPW